MIASSCSNTTFERDLGKRFALSSAPQGERYVFMKKIALSITLTACFCIGSTMACELSDEYSRLKKEISTQANNDYLECKKAVYKAKVVYRYSQCIKKGDALNIGGGCGHIVGNPIHGYKELQIDDEFCVVINPSSTEMEARITHYLNMYVENDGTLKCK